MCCHFIPITSLNWHKHDFYRRPLSHRSLWTEQVFVALPPTHDLAMQPALSWNQIRRERFLVQAGRVGPDTRNCLIKQLAEPSFEPEKFTTSAAKVSLSSSVWVAALAC